MYQGTQYAVQTTVVGELTTLTFSDQLFNLKSLLAKLVLAANRGNTSCRDEDLQAHLAIASSDTYG